MSSIDTEFINDIDGFTPAQQLQCIIDRTDFLIQFYKHSPSNRDRKKYQTELQELTNLFSHVFRGHSIMSFYIDEDEF